MPEIVNIKTVLVTGAAGFLGSHLCDALLSHGNRENLVLASKNPRFSFHQLDVSEADKLCLLSEGVDVCAHLAAFKIPRYGNRLKTLLVNSQGTLNILELAAEKKAKFVFTSTSDVYGRNPAVPFSETSESVLGPSTVARWAYAASKLFDEHLAMGFKEKNDVPVTILRIFGSYGPRQHLSWWGGPQSVFIDAILNGESIPIHGDGLHERTLTPGVCAVQEDQRAGL